MTTYYLTTPEGSCIYPIFIDQYNIEVPNSVRQWHAGGGKYGHLVLTEAPVTEIIVRQKIVELTGTWVLDDPKMESASFPLLIDKTAYTALDDDRQGFYSANTVHRTDEICIDVSTYLPITGDAPPAVVPTNWKPSAWAEIYGPAAAHVVSGVLTGLRGAIITIAKQYGDTYARPEEHGPIKVGVKSYWDPPKFTTSGKGRNARRTQTWMTSEVMLDYPATVAGSTLAGALAEWARVLAEVHEILATYKDTRTCSHCNGRGFISAATADI